MSTAHKAAWQSPGVLFRELGAERLYAYRPCSHIERSAVLATAELDDNIRNYGWAIPFRLSDDDRMEPIIFFEHGAGQHSCFFLAFDYTEGKFFFSLRSKGDDKVSFCDIFEIWLRGFVLAPDRGVSILSLA